MSVKKRTFADRRASTVRVFPQTAGGAGQARTIVEASWQRRRWEHAMEYPVTTESHFRDPNTTVLALSAFYDDWG